MPPVGSGFRIGIIIMRRLPSVSILLGLLGLLGLLVLPVTARPAPFIEVLLTQGVPPNAIWGTDARGVPLACGSTDPDEASFSRHLVAGHPGTGHLAANPDSLPPNTRGMDLIPSVIWADGVDDFFIEVNVNGPVLGVSIPSPSFCLTPNAGPLVFVDDGSNGDRVAGDQVFTLGPLSFSLGCSGFFPDHFQNDPNSPQGLHSMDVGEVVIEETDGSTTTFLIQPHIGLLRTDVALRTPTALDADAQALDHVINVATSYHATARFLHVGGAYDIPTLTNRIYAFVPDAVHQFVFLSIERIERLPRLTNNNFYAGIHATVRVDYTGSSSGQFDNSAAYGSAGVLMGVNGLDNLGRGVHANNAMHEITHQWAARISNSLGMTDGAHYKPRSSAASLVGGFQWLQQPDSTYTLNCDEGRNGARHAPPLDRYMAGFTDGTDITLHKYDPSLIPAFLCDSVVTSIHDIDITDIQSIHGVRSPGPGSSQKEFNVVFVAESNGRLLTATEMTFYDILAEHFGTAVPEGNPDPHLGFNWAPGTRYWGPGVTWNTQIPRPAPVDAGTWSRPSAVWLHLSPNPLVHGTRIHFHVPRLPGPRRLKIFDIAGHLVREFELGRFPNGDGSVLWDGTDNAGVRAPSGVYLASLSSPAGKAVKRVVIVR
jgi:hypothetical protein